MAQETIEKLDNAACALAGVQYLLERQRDPLVQAEQVAHILETINDVIIDCVDELTEQRSEGGNHEQQ
jgi:hypothetical protein